MPKRLSTAFLLLCLWAVSAFAQSGMVINGSRTIYGSLNTAVDTGSTDAYVITLTPPIPNYVTGTRYTFKANTANTGACSLNIDARGVTAIKVRNGSAKIDPPSNTICAGQYVDLVYDGTDFQMISQPCTAAAGGVGDALVANPLSQFAATSSAQLAAVLSDEQGTSGGFARIDGLLVVASGKTLTASNTVTFTGTDGSSIAFGGGGTLAYTSGNVATATALAADPAACPTGPQQFVTDMAANGTLTCATPAGGGDVTHVGTPTSGQLALWTGTTSLQAVSALPAALLPAFTGDITNTAGSVAMALTPGVVTFAKMAPIATARLIGRTTGGTGDPEALSVLPTALLPALVGDVTTSGGTLTTVLANVPSGTPHAGSALLTAITAPSTPAAGKGSLYVDSTSKNVAVKDDAGVVKHGVQTIICSGQFVNAINDAGLPTCSATVTTPVISSFASATHTHADAAGGGQLTRAALTSRTGTATSSATPTINTDNISFYSLTAQAVDITSFTTNLSGATFTEDQTLWIAITGTAARGIAWGASFENGACILPTTTVSTTRLDVGFVRNAVTGKWRCMASG